MSQFSSSEPIAEGNVAATLKSVLDAVVFQNEECTALVSFRIEKLGSVDAKVVLVFDDAQCLRPKTTP